MGNPFKTNICEELVFQYAEAELKQKWRGFEFLVPVPVVQARSLNKLPALYATTVRGKEHQLKIAQTLNPSPKYVVQKTLLEVVSQIQSKKLTVKYNDPKLLHPIINVNELAVREVIERLLRNDFRNKSQYINILEVESLVLNQIIPKYASLRGELHHYSLEINTNRTVTATAVRRAINQVLTNMASSQPLEDDNPTNLTAPGPFVGSVFNSLTDSSAIGFNEKAK